MRELIDGPIVWAPAADGAVVMSLRGGDFELTVGQDFSIGYLDHTGTSVLLYLQETFTFRVLSPQAAVPLTYPAQDEVETRHIHRPITVTRPLSSRRCSHTDGSISEEGF